MSEQSCSMVQDPPTLREARECSEPECSALCPRRPFPQGPSDQLGRREGFCPNPRDVHVAALPRSRSRGRGTFLTKQGKVPSLFFTPHRRSPLYPPLNLLNR